MCILSTELIHFSADLLKSFFIFCSPCSANSVTLPPPPQLDVNAGLRPILLHVPNFFPLPDFCYLAFAI